MLGIEFTGKQHELQLLQQYRKGLVNMKPFCVAEGAGDTGAIGQVMQPVAFLHQASAKTRGDIASQAPPWLREREWCVVWVSFCI